MILFVTDEELGCRCFSRKIQKVRRGVARIAARTHARKLPIPPVHPLVCALCLTYFPNRWFLSRSFSSPSQQLLLRRNSRNTTVVTLHAPLSLHSGLQ